MSAQNWTQNEQNKTNARFTKTEKKAAEKAVKQEVKSLVKTAQNANAVLLTSPSLSSAEVTSLKLLATMAPALKKMKESKKFSGAFLGYLKCITNPSHETKFRCPDGYSRESAVVCSEHILQVSGNYTATNDPSDMGRFCYVFSPTLADLGFLDKEQTIQVMRNPMSAVYPNQFNVNVYGVGSHAAWMNPDMEWDTLEMLDAGAFLTDDPVVKKHPGFARHGKLLSRFKELKQICADLRFEMASISGSKSTAPKKLGKLLADYCKAKLEKKSIIPLDSVTGSWNFAPDPILPTLSGSANGDPTISFNTGLSCDVRPVGMSVWFQNTATEFADGGKIAACLLPGNSLVGNVVPNQWTTAPVYDRQGPLVNWENLAEIQGAYCGPFKTGSYSYWKPDKPSDIAMGTTLENAINPFPYIVVAGQVMNGSIEDPGIIGNIIVKTVWEYTTDNQAIDTEYGELVPHLFEETRALLHGLPTSMSNDSHEKWWKVLLKTLGSGAIGFLTGGPAGAVGAAAGYLTTLA